MPAFPCRTTSEDRELIKEALAGAQGTVGFRTRAALNDAPELREKTRLAVARAKEGDVEALRFLYVTYSHNIYGYVRSIVRDDHEAEDVTQHVFAKLMTSIVKYDDRGVPFFAWLLRLARNVAIDHLRANRLTPTEEVLDPASPSEVEFDRAEMVRTALAALPVEQREVVVLRHVVGLSPSEIADRMGRTESSIHGLHHRGRRALQQELRLLDSTPATRPARARATRSAPPELAAA
jgi:RNA polymerase sigma-70 factor, ECF subfamily